MKTLTTAQRSNFLPVTALGYAFWREHSLTLLTGEPFSLRREAHLFTALASPRAGERWLDIGSSTGFYAGVLARAGCQVDALDLSPQMRRMAARREPLRQIHWLALNGEQTGLASQHYDGVTIGATLNETACPAAMLREAERVLKPGGQLWLMYVTRTGSLGQRFLSHLGGLAYPEIGWIERQVPQLRLCHVARFGSVEFALLQKGRRLTAAVSGA